MATVLCVQYTLDLATDLFLNQGGTSGTVTTIRPTSITGLDGRPIQGTIVPNAGTSGSDKLTHQLRGRPIVVEGYIVVFVANQLVTPADAVANGATAYLTQVNTLVDAWVAGLEGALNTPFNLNFTPTGLGADSLSVTYGVEGPGFQSVPSPDLSDWTTVSFTLFAESG